MATEGTDPPPAYQETEAIKNDGQTETQTATNENKQANEPPPEGEGNFGSPLKRIMYVGGIYLLYAILAFWYPVYWMDYNLNYCDKQCEAAYEDDPNSLAACEAICDQFETPDEITEAAAGWSLITIGLALSAVGVILAYFGVKGGNRLYNQIAAGLLLFGGVMQIIGIIVVIQITEDPEEVLLASLITKWLMVTIPAVIAIILAIDIWLNAALLNDEKKRALALSSVLFAVGGLMGGILYAYIANYEWTYPSGSVVISIEHPFKDEMGCIAAGYFIIGIMAVVRILVNFDVIKMESADNLLSLNLAVACLLVVGSIICAAGYWALVDVTYDCDDLTGMCPEIPYEGQDKCWHVGYTFFIIGIAVVNALDMGIIENCKACQAKNAGGGNSNPPTAQ